MPSWNELLSQLDNVQQDWWNNKLNQSLSAVGDYGAIGMYCFTHQASYRSLPHTRSCSRLHMKTSMALCL